MSGKNVFRHSLVLSKKRYAAFKSRHCGSAYCKGVSGARASQKISVRRPSLVPFTFFVTARRSDSLTPFYQKASEICHKVIAFDE